MQRQVIREIFQQSVRQTQRNSLHYVFRCVGHREQYLNERFNRDLTVIVKFLQLIQRVYNGFELIKKGDQELELCIVKTMLKGL